MTGTPNAGEGPQRWTTGSSERERGFERRLVVLMAARLVLSVVSLAVTLGLEAAGEPFTTAEWRGFYTTVAFAFLATIVYGLMLHRVIRPMRFAALNVATDVAIVTALVHFSGGHDSVFPFLYVLVAVYGAFLFDSRGAVGTALLATSAHGGVLLAAYRGWIPSLAIGPPEAGAVILTNWVVTSGAVMVVAVLANLLTAELRRTGAALDQRTSDLRRLQNLHQRTVHSLMSGLLTTDRDLRVTSFNPEAERITATSESAALGRFVEEVVPGVEALARLASETGEAVNTRSRLRFTNGRGEELHLGLAVYFLREADGSPEGFVVIFQDVTEVVEMESELRRSERLAAVGELSASIAHEIRNPLAAISGSIQVLRRQVDSGPAEGEPGRLMDIVVREADRLNRLITDFLQYARPGQAKLESVALDAVVDDVVEMFEPVAPGDVRLEVRVEPGLRVTADSAQLRQVLWNLVLNAVQAMPDGGRLTISGVWSATDAPQAASGSDRNEVVDDPKQGLVEIRVTDEGCGVASEALERVFDPFFTTKEDGSGLGLAAVHRIVEEHGGVTRLESRVGEGTAAIVRLPGTRETE